MASVTRTAREVITDALAVLGVLGAAEGASADDASFCLRRLVDLLASWDAQPLMTYTPALWGETETDNNPLTPWGDYDTIIGAAGRDRTAVALPTVTTLDSVMTLPGEYFRALTYALAVEVAPTFEREPTTTLLGLFAEAVRVVKVRNRISTVPSLRREIPTCDDFWTIDPRTLS